MTKKRIILIAIAMLVPLLLCATAVHAQPVLPGAAGLTGATGITPSPGFRLPDISGRENFSSALQLLILMTVLSLAPSIIIMMTCFTRIVIVLSLLRQALGTQQLPPNQILIGLSMFMTFLVMSPTLRDVNDTSLQPFLNGQLEQRQALDLAAVPIRSFMIRQVDASGNWDDVQLFHQYGGHAEAKTWSEVSTFALIPGFMLSELKTAFLMGFTIYLPFLVIDMVISTVLISMGMMMLPPVLISLPFKLLLFVLVDGWRLIVTQLLVSFS